MGRNIQESTTGRVFSYIPPAYTIAAVIILAGWADLELTRARVHADTDKVFPPIATPQEIARSEVDTTTLQEHAVQAAARGQFEVKNGDTVLYVNAPAPLTLQQSANLYQREQKRKADKDKLINDTVGIHIFPPKLNRGLIDISAIAGSGIFLTLKSFWELKSMRKQVENSRRRVKAAILRIEQQRHRRS